MAAPAGGVVVDPKPLARHRATGAIARCAAATVALVARGRLCQPRDQIGRRVRFADGTTACVFRVTDVAAADPVAPCLVVVAFTLRHVRSERAHAAFRALSVCNTVLFAGFPGMRVKLWLDHDENGRYRGLYEWDGTTAAVAYVRALWRALALASHPDTIHGIVLPNVRLADVLSNPDAIPLTGLSSGWWRVTGVDPVRAAGAATS